MNIEYLVCKILKKLRLKAVIGSEIDSTVHICSGSHVVNSKLSRYTDVGYDCKLVNVEMGAFCSLASGIIIGSESHPMNWVSMSSVFTENRDSIKRKFAHHQYRPSIRTYIGNDVWIGDRAIIKAGVRVGNGAVIGMGSVVTHDVGAYEVWAGNPARMIKRRFDEETAFQLESLAWWEWDEQKLEQAGEMFNDVSAFLNANIQGTAAKTET